MQIMATAKGAEKNMPKSSFKEVILYTLCTVSGTAEKNLHYICQISRNGKIHFSTCEEWKVKMCKILRICLKKKTNSSYSHLVGHDFSFRCL